MIKWFPRWAYLLLCIVVIGAIAGGCQDGNFLTPPVQTIGATLNSTAADGEPRYSYDGRYLVFSSDRNAQRGIFLYDVQQRRLVDLPGLNQPNILQEQPDISADGRYIVYISEEFGKPDVFVYDRQTMESKRITENILVEVRHPTISGNGRFIAFESNRSGQWDIEIYDRGAKVDLSLPIDRSQPSDTNAPSPTPPQ
ncbi:TolB family protein [Limnofasciculus baicalensis]|uniref:Biopolymer transporter n=1 Tax=Limnofasciculus baicalensis BBK-W-15 TaxID=2699891 RepID=A0AAE3GUU3_9CYAN|nr:biopolymer transporter [Limnofasciculus baicalensis]MCP2731051.1 biopolymer transporter [Limnofasciculus baicalensis BBK-W-15]